MKLNFVGDFGKLKKLGRDVGKERALLFFYRLSQDLTKEALFLTREGFRNSTDPTGRSWRRPKHRKGGRPLVVDAGRLFRSWRDRSTYRRVEIYSTAPYAAPLQRGTRHMKARRMVPTTRLPARWMSRFVTIFWENVRRLMKGD